ncbi:hypothetical protein [Haloquadratum walsbyi]|jgi:hypothetical protein|uniref:Uncharacterized protein n=1 Tax=Haloquadratum walsbyi J07HQW2 TaxID=1238425 RepID=U1NJ30_9EURY|nr:hypothetical protein [Haloquadratum walsbyi]ERG96923.1 MAG: hypothetical protein J07HQW2_03407 [Haloquadratum walsbyi J07HQW2]
MNYDTQREGSESAPPMVGTLASYCIRTGNSELDIADDSDEQ